MAHTLKHVLIDIDTTNAAFNDYPHEPGMAEYEVGRILLALAGRLRAGERLTLLRDLNGNHVGTVTYHTSEETHEDE